MSVKRYLSLLVALSASEAGHAQTESRAGVTGYDAAYFVEMQPNTALDMVRLVPGFRVQGGDTEVRGFSGTAGNVLIDGRVPTSKEESIEELLQRIPASGVARVELIRSGASDVDMRGFALLANVVRLQNTSVQGRAELEGHVNDNGHVGGVAGLTLTRKTDERALDLAFNFTRETGNDYGYRNRYDANGAPLRLLDYTIPGQFDSLQGSVQYRRPLFGGQFSVGGVAQLATEDEVRNDQIHFPAPELVSSQGEQDQSNIELRMQHEQPFGDANQLQLFAIYRAIDSDESEYEVSNDETELSVDRSESSESILRAAWRHERGSSTYETGVEGAINILDSGGSLFVDGLPEPLPADNVRVEERRAEFFVNGTWRLSDPLSAEAGLRYETSTLEQTGDSNTSRNLSFPKPRALLTWLPAPNHEMRFLVEREVSQLNFNDFVSSANLANDNVTAGNQNLQPDSTWRFAVSWEVRFWERGSLTLTARHDAISDLIDNVPVVIEGETFNAVGNIGDGLRNELDLSFIVPLDRLGLRGFTLQGDVIARDTEATDPVTGARRNISGEESLSGEVELTQDINRLKLRWGVLWEVASEYTIWRIDETFNERRENEFEGFIEYKPSPSWTFRLFGRDVNASTDLVHRTAWTGLREQSPIRFLEQQTEASGAYVGASLQYSFGR